MIKLELEYTQVETDDQQIDQLIFKNFFKSIYKRSRLSD